MKNILKYFNKVFLIFTIITFFVILFYFNNKVVAIDFYYYLRLVGGFLALIGFSIYTFYFYTSRDLIFQSQMLKRIIKLFLMYLFLGFSLAIAGVFFDLMLIVQETFAQAGYFDKIIEINK